MLDDVELAGLSGMVALMKMREEGEWGGGWGWGVTRVEAEEEADCVELDVGVEKVVCSGESI